MNNLDKYIKKAIYFHKNCNYNNVIPCPGLILGVRMGIIGGNKLGVELPDNEKRLIVFVEIDRCATDGIAAITGCTLGKRTLKYIDYGKMAATFLDLKSKKAIRIVALESIREKANKYISKYISQNYLDRFNVQKIAYEIIPDEEMFKIQEVIVNLNKEDYPGPPKKWTICSICGERINDGREIKKDGKYVCKACAYGSYYNLLI